MNETTPVVSPGDSLLELCRQTTKELVVVAPFIKVSAFKWLLTHLDPSVRPVCITRWLPSELAAGVSDLEVFDAVVERNGTLWLRQNLHAKYFRGDSFVLIGSANVTGAAMGWSVNANLELLVPIDRSVEGVMGFEELALSRAIRVDRNLYEMFAEASQDWRAVDEGEAESRFVKIPDIDLDHWFPVSRNLDSLYDVYSGNDLDSLPLSTREAATRDLAVLHPPSGLSEEAFRVVIGAVLLTMPVIGVVDRQLMTSQRFGVIRDLLRDQLDLSREDGSRAWQTIIRWFQHFLPNRYSYSRPGYSEIIARID